VWRKEIGVSKGKTGGAARVGARSFLKLANSPTVRDLLNVNRENQWETR